MSKRKKDDLQFAEKLRKPAATLRKVGEGMTKAMTNEAGTVINSRTAVAISSATSVTIVLSGADLDLDDGAVRVVTVECTYNSGLGSNLPLKDQVTFFVDDLTIVS